MKAGIIGTRGIPNQYGGFEQFAEYLSRGLVERGHEVAVYNVHHHPYKEKYWNGVQILHQYDPEPSVGTAGQFIYDLNCILDSRRRDFDIILQLGYTSSSVWSFLMPSRSKVLTNMDGLEWKRTKYSAKVQRFLRWAEKRAVLTSDALIADSVGIQQYLENTYRKEAIYIPYGAEVFHQPDPSFLTQWNVEPYAYNMLVARMEPENNIETILEGAAQAGVKRTFLVIGNPGNTFGKYLQQKFSAHPHIQFCGAVYNLQALNNLRWFSGLYFHGHSVGGTNPSLLEAMASKAFIVAHKNLFNESILQKEALYFSSAGEVQKIIETAPFEQDQLFRDRNYEKIQGQFRWDQIIDQYEHFFKRQLAIS